MATDRQKSFYHKQRLEAEERADEGDTRARGTVSKIYGKLGKKDRQYTNTSEKDGMLMEGMMDAASGGLGLAGAVGRKGLGMAAKAGVKAVESAAPKAAESAAAKAAPKLGRKIKSSAEGIAAGKKGKAVAGNKNAVGSAKKAPSKPAEPVKAAKPKPAPKSKAAPKPKAKPAEKPAAKAPEKPAEKPSAMKELLAKTESKAAPKPKTPRAPKKKVEAPKSSGPKKAEGRGTPERTKKAKERVAERGRGKVKAELSKGTKISDAAKKVAKGNKYIRERVKYYEEN